MKKALLFFVVLLTFCSCDKKTKPIPKKTANKETPLKKTVDTLLSDSLAIESLLKEALLETQPYLHKSSFKKEYKTISKGNVYVSKVTLEYGNLFSKKHKHLIVHLYTPQIIIGIYKLTNDNFKQVMYREESQLSYMDDIIKDVNGDGKKDFLVHWYPMSGCCRRNVYNVYLYQEKEDTFTKDYEFINPTFFPKEKIIRGLSYGHNASLYKYKWNKLAVDTLEFVIRDTTGLKFYLTKKDDYNNPPLVKSRIVSQLPREYENIESIEVFTNN